MLRALFKTAQSLVIMLAAYNAVTALWGWRQRQSAPVGSRAQRFRVVIPAHNEAAVIRGVLADLEQQDYPKHLVSTVVLADRCTDDTAILARPRATVAERRDGPAGKGHALAWYLARDPLVAGEALVVVDADNRLPPDLLGRFADELEDGNQVLQAYLDVSNPDESMLATAGALSYWAGNRMVQLARTNLGWSSDLGGTGMCLAADALAHSGGFGGSLTEDQEIGARLALAGERVTWLHDVRIYDEKPRGVAATIGQRSRWMSGKRAVAKQYAPQLMQAGIEQRRLALIDQALRLVQPGRSFVALLSGLITIAAGVFGGAWWLPWQVWATAAATQFLQPIPFLARDGVPKRYLLRYPLLVLLAGLWAPIRFVSRRSAAWYHTPHGAAVSGDR